MYSNIFQTRKTNIQYECLSWSLWYNHFFCVMISYKFCAHYKQTFSIISASLGFNTICVFLKPYYVCNFKWIVNVIRSRMYVPAYITYVYYEFIIHFNWQN